MASKKVEIVVDAAAETKKSALQVALGIQVVSARALGNLLSSTMDAELGREKPDLRALAQISKALARSATSAEDLAEAAI